jgi:hypothetical protein
VIWEISVWTSPLQRGCFFVLTFSVFFFFFICITRRGILFAAIKTMDIYRILHYNIPDKKKIILLLKKKSESASARFLIKIIKRVSEKTPNFSLLNAFCIELYDHLYHHLMFNKIKIQKKITRILEDLALPLPYAGEEKRKQNFRKLIKTKL